MQARAFHHRAGNDIVFGRVATRHGKAFPRALRHVLSETRGIAYRRAKNSGGRKARNTTAHIQQHQPDRAADRRVRAKARAEAAIAAMHADLPGVRAVDDHERSDPVHRALHAAHIELIAQDQRERTEHDRQIFRLASRHQRVDRNLAHRRHGHRRRHAADDFVGTAPRAAEHPLHALVGRRDDGETVRPFLLEKELKLVDLYNQCEFSAKRGFTLRAAPSATGPPPLQRQYRKLVSWPHPSSNPRATPRGRPRCH